MWSFRRTLLPASEARGCWLRLAWVSPLLPPGALLWVPLRAGEGSPGNLAGLERGPRGPGRWARQLKGFPWAPAGLVSGHRGPRMGDASGRADANVQRAPGPCLQVRVGSTRSRPRRPPGEACSRSPAHRPLRRARPLQRSRPECGRTASPGAGAIAGGAWGVRGGRLLGADILKLLPTGSRVEGRPPAELRGWGARRTGQHTELGGRARRGHSLPLMYKQWGTAEGRVQGPWDLHRKCAREAVPRSRWGALSRWSRRDRLGWRWGAVSGQQPPGGCGPTSKGGFLDTRVHCSLQAPLCLQRFWASGQAVPAPVLDRDSHVAGCPLSLS